MPATPNDYPTSYAEAAQKLGGRIAKNLSGTATRLERVSGLDGDSYAVKHHSTDIVMFHADGRVDLNTGGWHTATTVRKMRACLSNQPYTVRIIAGIITLLYHEASYRLVKPATVTCDGNTLCIITDSGNEVTLH